MNPLTDKQRAVLDAIVDGLLDCGISPALRELANRFGVHVNSVLGHLRALERKGHLVPAKRLDRARVLTEKGRQLYRRCEACAGKVHLRRMAFDEMLTVEDALALADELRTAVHIARLDSHD